MAAATEFTCGDCRPCDKCKGELEVEVQTLSRADGRFAMRLERVECDRCEGAGRECAVWQSEMCSITETCACECAD